MSLARVLNAQGNPYGSHLRLDSKSDFELFARHAVGWRQDAGLTTAFARQLEHVFTKVFEAEFPQYRAHDFFPTNTEVEPGAIAYTYRMTQRIGQAQVVNANAKDLNNIDVGAEEWQQPVLTLGASYNFSQLDQLSGQFGNFAIEAAKAKATREAIEFLEESIYAQGFSGVAYGAGTAAGVYGVTSCPGIIPTTQASSGTWTAQLITAAAAGPLSASALTSLVGDLLAAKQAVFSRTLGRHNPTNVLLAPNLYSALDTVPQSPLFTNKTVLEWIQDVVGMDIDYWPILQNAGAINGSPLTYGLVTVANPQQKTRTIVYEKNPEVMQLIQVQPFVQLAPQPTGLVWEIPCYSRIGGAMSIRPLGITYIDGL